MKKTLLLLPVLALTACDKPTTSIELECSMNKDWQKPVSMLRTDEDYKNQVPVLVDVKAYNDHAVLVVNGKESTFYKSKEEKSMGEFGRVFVDYEGIFPDTDRLATFSFYGDIGSKTILQFDLHFDGEYKLHDGKRFNMGHSCTPTKKEYIGDNWSANAPWNHDYKMPNKTEKCITEIVNKVICNSDKCDRLILSDEKNKTLSQEEDKKISENTGKSSIEVSLFNKIFVKEIEVDVLPKTEVVPVGNIAGVKLYTSGVLVVRNVRNRRKR